MKFIVDIKEVVEDKPISGCASVILFLLISFCFIRYMLMPLLGLAVGLLYVVLGLVSRLLLGFWEADVGFATDLCLAFAGLLLVVIPFFAFSIFETRWGWLLTVIVPFASRLMLFLLGLDKASAVATIMLSSIALSGSFYLVKVPKESGIRGVLSHLILPFIAFLAVGWLFVSQWEKVGNLQAHAQRWQESHGQRREETGASAMGNAKDAEEKKTSQRMEGKIKAFALAESPGTWKIYSDLGGMIKEQERRLEKLRTSLTALGRSPGQDGDLGRVERQLTDLRESRDAIHSKLIDAYIEKGKFEATLGNKRSAELWRRALDDGIKEAEAASRRFEAIRNTK